MPCECDVQTACVEAFVVKLTVPAVLVLVDFSSAQQDKTSWDLGYCEEDGKIQSWLSQV